MKSIRWHEKIENPNNNELWTLFDRLPWKDKFIVEALQLLIKKF